VGIYTWLTLVNHRKKSVFKYDVNSDFENNAKQTPNYMTGKEHVIIVAQSNPVTLLTGQIQYVLSLV